jgi:hypothetical protein
VFDGPGDESRLNLYILAHRERPFRCRCSELAPPVYDIWTKGGAPDLA